MASETRVCLFAEGDKDQKDLLGGKGANLAEMTNLGLPVPPGFIITTKTCNQYTGLGEKMPPGLMEEVRAALAQVEKEAGKRFGEAKNPLLVSVRSGAKFSMPGMMDTVLNLGLNRETLRGLIALTGNERFGYDAYRRFLMMFSDIVLHKSGVGRRADGGPVPLARERFESLLEELKEKKEVKHDTDLGAEDLKQLAARFEKLIEKEWGRSFPADPWEQLEMAIEAVFRSWNGKRAIDYRNFHKIPHDLGTAVNVQTMVFGNMGEDSGTGVAFTRDAATGEKALYGEYLMNAQGEDVVAGVRTPVKIGELARQSPELYRQFAEICQKLENHYREVMDIEFTIERGRLYILQCRVGKRTAAAAVKIAVDMVKEGLIDRETAITRVEPGQVNQLLLPRFDPKAKQEAVREGRLLAKGLNASPGAAAGLAVFDADRAEELGSKGEAVVLVRTETSPDDVHGMLTSKGILTARGGATSHAAVVARGLGLPCVAGCEAIRVDEERRLFSADGKEIREMETISLDGTTGEVFAGEIATIAPNFQEEKDLITLLGWADERRRLGVWANADYPRDAARAREFGAEGIGLCRTEHMFMEQERLPIVQEMILAEGEQERRKLLDKLLPFQRGDFRGIFEVMDGLPVVIRLIDPPLHEFLPSHDELLTQVTEIRTLLKSGCLTDPDDAEYKRLRSELPSKEKLLAAVEKMAEMNPMLGLRGCRLGLLMPEIIEMQTRAILEAACEAKRAGREVHAKIMIPLVGHANELKVTRSYLEAVAKQVLAEEGLELDYKFGTMIEIPRAALTADAIAQVADFFSFGTNDLTQTTFGFSRDDAEGKFLLKYVEEKILPVNPFQTLDREGVGALVAIAVEKGRKANPHLELGICGEHGGDPDSIEFCHQVGLDYVSCSPFRVPVARLAAAQAALAEKGEAPKSDTR
jgi:pyruvate,orthophosphate dikinase